MVSFLKNHYKKILLVIGVIIIVLVIAERFITQGTFLGYQVRKNNLVEQAAKPSQACEKAGAKFISSVLGKDVKRIASGLADQEKPLRSICSYMTEGKNRRYVTVVIRHALDEAGAEQQLKAIAQRKDAKSLNDIGTEAYFIGRSRQLTARQGKEITTVTVSDPSKQSKISSFEAAKKIIQKLI